MLTLLLFLILVRVIWMTTGHGAEAMPWAWMILSTYLESLLVRVIDESNRLQEYETNIRQRFEVEYRGLQLEAEQAVSSQQAIVFAIGVDRPGGSAGRAHVRVPSRGLDTRAGRRADSC